MHEILIHMKKMVCVAEHIFIEEDILRGADMEVNTFTFNSVSVFCLQRIDVVHLIQLRDENEPFQN